MLTISKHLVLCHESESSVRFTPRTDSQSFTKQKEQITLSAVTPFYGLLINLIRISACPFSVNSCRYRRQPIIFTDKHLRASVIRRTFQNNLLFPCQNEGSHSLCFLYSSVHHSLFHSIHSKSSALLKCVNESERVRRLKERMGREKMRKDWKNGKKIRKRKKKRWETKIWEKMWKIKDKYKARATPSVLHWHQSRTCLYFMKTL